MGTENLVNIEGYHSIPRNRKKCARNNRYYGGLNLFIRQTIKEGIEELNPGDSETIWVKIKKEFFKMKEDIFIGFVYIVPKQMSHADPRIEDRFQIIEREVQNYQSKGKVLIMGDLNARTGCKEDFIRNDSGRHLPGEDWYPVDKTNRGRVSKDQVYDSEQGQKLLDLCISSQMRILNGRTIGDISGKFTCFRPNGVSVVDYAVCQEQLIPLIKFFQVHDFKGEYSDHCKISCNLQIKYKPKVMSNNTQAEGHQKIIRYKWSKETGAKYQMALEDKSFITQVESFLDKHQPGVDVDAMTSTVNSLMHGVANKALVGNSRQGRKSKRKSSNKKWFDYDCVTMRRRVAQLSKLIVKYPRDPIVRGNFYKTKKQYKNLVKRKRKEHKNMLLQQLEIMSEQNPSTYWKILDDLRNEEKDELKQSPISLNEWAEYFKKLTNSHTGTNNCKEVTENMLNNIEKMERAPTFCELDYKITIDEIKLAIKKLKNNKAPGIDGIIAEMIKSGQETWSRVLLKLYNHIFTSKQYPKCWSISLLTPIHKKGDRHNPDNYRGISVNSVLAKIYSMILLNRIESYINSNKIMRKEQIGFQKKARTSDHMFVLHTLFQKYTNGGKLYTCFVDFRKAYDYVWRNALLYKILKLNIRGLFYYQIKEMYKNVEMAVKQNGLASSPFSSTLGVKQGDVLSPTLFNLYINDMPSIFDQSCDKVRLGNQDLSCLLYADDMVLLSHTKQGLQNCLNKLHSYCQEWQMELNLDKTKIMIMSKSGKMYNDQLYFGTHKLQNVKEYNYLGLTFACSGSFTTAKINIKNKAMKAAGKLKRLLYEAPIKKHLSLRLFDQLIRPILTYGCEIWGTLDIPAKRTQQGGQADLEIRFDKLPQEGVNISFAKFLLGVSSKTSNLGVMGDLGRYPMYLYIINQMRKYYYRLTKLNNDSLLKSAFEEQKQLSSTNKKCWLNQVRNIMDYYKLNTEGQNSQNMGKPESTKTMKILEQRYRVHWNERLNWITQHTSSKLDTYRSFKTEFYYEPFVDIHDRQQQIALSKLRLSNHKLQIEMGRYTKPKTDRAQRLCKLCNEGVVEDENHFLLQCPVFADERKELLEKLLPTDKTPLNLQQLLSKYTLHSIQLVAAFVHGAFHKRQDLLITKPQSDTRVE
jgi:hypothetical protein